MYFLNKYHRIEKRTLIQSLPELDPHCSSILFIIVHKSARAHTLTHMRQNGVVSVWRAHTIAHNCNGAADLSPYALALAAVRATNRSCVDRSLAYSIRRVYDSLTQTSAHTHWHSRVQTRPQRQTHLPNAKAPILRTAV